jgi:excisionase family DNA binding protein
VYTTGVRWYRVREIQSKYSPRLLPRGGPLHTLVAMDHITVDIPKDWLSVADICEYMGVSAFVVTSQLRSGGLPAVKFGREWRVSRVDFENWINEQRASTSGSLDYR